VGGLTTGGLGQTDIGNKAAIGGLARDFYRAVKQHYADPAAWKWQPPASYRSGGQTMNDPQEDAMWTFEPSVALGIFQRWLAEHRIAVVLGERLDRDGGVLLTQSPPPRITAIRMESGRVFPGAMFIDASYEGDLMAAAGVEYTVGREAPSTGSRSTASSMPRRCTTSCGPGWIPMSSRAIRGVAPALHRGRCRRRGRCRQPAGAGRLFPDVPHGPSGQPHPVRAARGL
jgi:hypothetical protein